MILKAIVAATVAALAFSAPDLDAKQHRSGAAKNAFKKAHPCPASGKPRGPCPGYVVDHVTPLCAGGLDAPSNMQWQTIAEGKAKDKIEIQRCRKPRP